MSPPAVSTPQQNLLWQDKQLQRIDDKIERIDAKKRQHDEKLHQRSTAGTVIKNKESIPIQSVTVNLNTMSTQDNQHMPSVTALSPVHINQHVTSVRQSAPHY